MIAVIVSSIFFFAVIASWVAELRNGRFSVIGLVLFVPFGGLLQLWFSDFPGMVLAKDLLFVIPAYLWLLLRRTGPPQLGSQQACLVPIAIFAFWVCVELCNPASPPFVAALIGVKVWLFYIPFLFVGMAFIRTTADLVFILRLLIASAWVPCLLGIGEFIACYKFGYETTMYAIYGPAAQAATQGFAKFDVGGFLLRIPSSFSFPAQYYNYLLCMTTFSYAASRFDPSKQWRRFANLTCVIVMLASLLSGTRSSFLFTPLLFLLTCILDRRIVRFGTTALLLGAAGTAALFISGIDPRALWNLIAGLTLHYQETNTVAYVAEYLSLFGSGTGSGTVATRYILGTNLIGQPESYYAKAAYELGAFGLVIVALYLLVIVLIILSSYLRMANGPLRSVAAAVCAFVMTLVIYLFKGAMLDFDPLNVYFWFMVGITLRLPSLAEREPTSVMATLRMKITVNACPA